MSGRMPRMVIACCVVIVTLAFEGASRPVSAAACQTFTETGHQVCDPFLGYWASHGGLDQQGLPLTNEFTEVSPTNGKPYTVQYFERARFEKHPENAAPYDVLLGLLGREQFLAKYGHGGLPPGVPAGTGCDESKLPPNTRCINEHFGQYYLGHGALEQQGYAISNAFNEISPTNGKTYLVQYFERARFEYHPENEGTPYVILLGLLGREQFQAKYPNGQPGGATSAPMASPASVSFGSARVNTPGATKTITVTNPTGTGLQASAIGLQFKGANPDDFARAKDGGTCSTNGAAANGGTCIVNVYFKPTAIGNRTARPIIVLPTQYLEVDLSGTSTS